MTDIWSYITMTAANSIHMVLYGLHTLDNGLFNLVYMPSNTPSFYLGPVLYGSF